MKRITLLTAIVILTAFALPEPLLADTIFVGMQYSGGQKGAVMRLDPDFRPGAYNEIPHGPLHLELSDDQSRLYCVGVAGGVRRMSILDSTTLELKGTVDMPPGIFGFAQTLQPDRVADIRVLAPDGEYAIIASPAQNRIFKVAPDISAVIAERALPHPTAIIVTPNNFGGPGVVYSGGREIADIGDSDSQFMSNRGGGEFTVVVLAPSPGAVWSGVQNILYWHEYISAPDPGYADIYCNGEVLLDTDGSTSLNLRADGWFEWDTTTFNNSAESVVEVTVHYEGAEGSAQSGTFVVANGPLVGITDVIPEDGLITMKKRQPFHAQLNSYNVLLDRSELELDGILVQAKDLTGLASDTIDFTPTEDLAFPQEHIYELTVWDTNSNIYTAVRTFTVERVLGCFLAGTPILMADGTNKPIEELKVGDMLLALDEETNQLKPDAVKHVFVIPGEEEYLIINSHLRVTPHHNFYTTTYTPGVSVNGKWVEAGKLKVGDMLMDSKGEPEMISSIKRIQEPVTVYNLEVNPYHTFIAGGVIVHNAQFLKGTHTFLKL